MTTTITHDDLPETWSEARLQVKCEQQSAEIERLRAALNNIAKNTCCDNCQEAALVAQKFLNGDRS